MSADAGHGADSMGIAVLAPGHESCRGTTLWHFERFDADAVAWATQRLGHEPRLLAEFRRLGIASYRTTEHQGNLILNAGWTRLMNLLTNQGATQAYDATHTRIGAGNSATAVTYADTDLNAAAGAANRFFELVNGAGTLGTRTLAWTAVFASADGNFAWQEFGIDQGTANGTTVTAPMLNHAVSAQGTKASGQVWTATATFTFS
jgi:hypothetical protein